MVRIGTVIFNVADVPRAAEFWSQALGYAPRDGQIQEGWTMLKPPDGIGPNLAFDRGDRTHLDLYAGDRDEQEAEIERLISLGATRVEDWPYPDDADFVVLADPVGNLFCVVDTSR